MTTQLAATYGKLEIRFQAIWLASQRDLLGVLGQSSGASLTFYHTLVFPSPALFVTCQLNSVTGRAGIFLTVLHYTALRPFSALNELTGLSGSN